MPPALSIIIPAYNAGGYLEETIRAVLKEDFQDLELIVINNASTDDTASILENIRKELNDPRLRILRNPTTIPACENINLGIVHAKGEFIKVICADDLPAAGSLQRQVEALQKHPGVVLVTGARVIINAKGRRLFTTNRLGGEGVTDGKEAIKRCALAATNIIGDPVHVMWRKSAMERVGSFEPSVRYATDLDYWLKLLSVGDLYYDPTPAGYYRIHGGADSSGQWKATTDWVLKIFDAQREMNHLKLSGLQFSYIAFKAYLQGFLRGQIYKYLG
jgi:glycosyltransferase involved in cell wall biosynthesis